MTRTTMKVHVKNSEGLQESRFLKETGILTFTTCQINETNYYPTAMGNFEGPSPRNYEPNYKCYNGHNITE